MCGHSLSRRSASDGCEVVLQLTEIFYSLQGEGTYTGTAAIFVRLAGCNLSCSFCDTDYALKSLITVDQTLSAIRTLTTECRMVIITGGEPFIQKETIDLIHTLERYGYKVHVESNGTTEIELPDSVWLTVSPKTRVSPRMASRANEAKLIVDGSIQTDWLELFPRTTPVFLQPEGNKRKNIDLAVSAIQANPDRFRLSLQTHKFINIR